MVDVNIDDLSRYLAENIDLKNKIMEVVSDYLRDLESTMPEQPVSSEVTMSGFEPDEVQPQVDRVPSPAVPIIPEVEDNGYSSGEDQAPEPVATMSSGRVSRPPADKRSADKPSSAIQPTADMSLEEFVSRYSKEKVAAIKEFMKSQGIFPSGARKKSELLEKIYEDVSARNNFVSSKR